MASSSPKPIIAYTDGACSGNPGPAGLGVLWICDGERRTASEYLGHATNNIAELRAIECALLGVDDRSRPLELYTDSQYAIGVLTKGWKAKANKELIASIRVLASEFVALRFHHVRGHSGDPCNEAVDALARAAIDSRPR